MSIATQLSRIQTDRNTIRAKLVALGMATNTDNLDVLAAAINDLVNQGAVSVEIKEGTSYTIPAGYHNGSGVVKAITDTEGEAATYKTQAKTVTPTKTQQSVGPDEGYYALESVTVAPIPDAYQDVSGVTAAAANVLTGKIFVAKDGTVTPGAMTNNGAVSKTLDGTTVTYTIPKGYHDGTGTVKIVLETKTVTPTKAAQEITPTEGKVLGKVTVDPIPDEYQDVSGVTAMAGDVLVGAKFVDSEGNVVNGTMPEVDVATPEISVASDGTITAGVTQPYGCVNGGSKSATKYLNTKEGGTITPTKKQQTAVGAGLFTTGDVLVAPIPDEYQDVTPVTAGAADVLNGKKIVDAEGNVVEGGMANNGDVSATIDGITKTSVAIPAGYSTGGTVSLTGDIEAALAEI